MMGHKNFSPCKRLLTRHPRYAFLILLMVILLTGTFSAQARLKGTILETKKEGSKWIVKVEWSNGFNVPIESARAFVLLQSPQGEVLAKKMETFIGGPHQKSLAPGAKSVWFFVLDSPAQTVKTDLKVTRILLAGSKGVDANKNSEIIQSKGK
jgi:hypothetical protein